MASYRFTGARVWSPYVQDFIQRDLYVKNGQVAPPMAQAQTIALDGHLIFPAVLNAHDHLELNHYPRARFQERYDNAHQWGEDVNKRLSQDPFASLREQPLKTRLWHGGLKNLLCGALTVFQHGTPHRPLFRADFPVYIPRQYGWAHSLHFSTAEEIVRAYKKTPPHAPWFIHLAEGTDAIAAAEYQRLKAFGCIGENTVLVHGVGLHEDDLPEAARRTKGLVWCPSTNFYLLGRTANVEQWVANGGKLFLGSDSRLTADGDWLDEWHVAWRLASGQVRKALLDGITVDGIQALGIKHRGALEVGMVANFFVYAEQATVENNPLPQRQENIALIVRRGIPLIGDVSVMQMFPSVSIIEGELNNRPKAIHHRLARRIYKQQAQAPNLSIKEAQYDRHSFWSILLSTIRP